ncbi:MAG: hypothetical protein JXA11_11730 [Phycisphaerae bacterium]|nr:hypothetical protein [Phycisphaerae bacterium]
MRLEFQSTHAGGLLLTLLLGVSGGMCVYGLAVWIRGRRRAGLLGLSGVGGPVTACLALLLDAAWRFWRDDTAAARRSFLAGFSTLVLVIVTAVVWERTGDGGAFWMTLLGGHLATGLGLIYASTYRALGKGRFTTLLALRLGATAVLLVILFKPALMFPVDTDAHKPTLAVLLDRSGSMATRDQPDAPSRHARAARMLQSQGRRLGEVFRVQWSDFAAAAGAVSSVEQLAHRKPAGPGTDATDIVAGLRLAGQVQPGVGVLLLSDGIQNTPGDPAAFAESLGVPVYVAAVGSTKPSPGGMNLELLRVDAPLQAAADHAVDITARIRMTRLANRQAEVQLFEGNAAAPLASERISTTEDDAAVPVRFSWTPRNPADAESKDNPVTLRVRVSPQPAESTTDDNEIVLHVAVTEPTLRVLYIEGAVRPEYKYLRRLLRRDPNVQFAGLVRIGGNRFWSQGKLDGKGLAGLPTSDEDFRRFDVLILGDLAASFPGPARMDRIRRFVADGGGLVMLGGQSSFGPGGYDRTAVAAALPVVVGDRNQPQVQGQFVPQLTALGAEHPIFAGIAHYFSRQDGRAPDASVAPLPPLKGCVSVPRAKPGAAVLAVHPTERNEAGPLIVLAVEPFGAGRSAALTVDTTWRWYLPLQAMGVKSPYARFWRQMIRWLAGAEASASRDGAMAVLRAERTFARAGTPLPAQAYVRNTDGAPAKEAKVTMTIRPAGGSGESNPLDIQRKATESPGLFEGEIALTEPGKFIMTMTATDENGMSLGGDELPLTILPKSSERDDTARNDTLLRALADRSGGVFVELPSLPDLLDMLLSRHSRQTDSLPQARVQPLYHFPSLFVVFLLLLTAEWVLRRRWQLR